MLLIPSCLGFVSFPPNKAQVLRALPPAPLVQPRLISISLLLSRARQLMQFLLQTTLSIAFQSHEEKVLAQC